MCQDLLKNTFYVSPGVKGHATAEQMHLSTSHAQFSDAWSFGCFELLYLRVLHCCHGICLLFKNWQHHIGFPIPFHSSHAEIL